MRSIENYMLEHSGCGSKDSVFFVDNYLFYYNTLLDYMGIECFQDGRRTDVLTSRISSFFNDDKAKYDDFLALGNQGKFDTLMQIIPWQVTECSWDDITSLTSYYKMKIEDQFDWNQLEVTAKADAFDSLPEGILGHLILLGLFVDLVPSNKRYSSLEGGVTDWESLHDATWKSIMDDKAQSLNGTLATTTGRGSSLFIFRTNTD